MNSHGKKIPRDFKSLVSTNSTTQAREEHDAFFRGFCQLLKLLFSMFFLLSACSTSRNLERLPTYRPIKPTWFQDLGGKRYLNNEGDVLVHPFFDGKPLPGNLSETGNAQAFIINKPGDSLNYNLDLVSGKKYSNAPLCEQNDVWGKYENSLEKLSFSVGILPRALLGSGEPYPIFIFGKSEGIENSSFKYHTHEVRIVGGVNLQDCPKVNCRGGQWRNNIVPVAVFKYDEKLKDVENLDDLTFHYDMDYFYSFIQNYKGRVKGDRKDFPSFRLLSTLSLADTTRFLKSGSHIFSPEKVFYLKRNCGKLYEKVWNEIIAVKKSKSTKRLTESQVIKDYQKKILGNTVISENFSKISINKKSEDNTDFMFSTWLKKFIENDQENFELCSRFVKYSDDKGERWKFFLNLDLFSKLNKMGFVFSCSSRSWNKNYRNNDGEWVYSQKNYLRNCSDIDLDRGFEIAANYMGYERNKSYPYYEYIKKDPTFGSPHEKIYGWVLRNGKKLRCEDEKGNNIFEEMSNKKILKAGGEWTRFSDN